MIQIEGPHPGVGAPLLLGFGIVTAFLPGIPLGMVVGVVLYLLRRRSTS